MYVTKEWKRTAAEDCLWAYAHCNEFKMLCSLAVSMKEWEIMATENPKARAKAIKAAKTSERVPDKVGQEQDDPAQAMLSCSVCSNKFLTASALATHERNAHGKRHEAWQFAEDSVCMGAWY